MAKPSMPGLIRKHLKPATPASASAPGVRRFCPVNPPHGAQSTQHWPPAATRLASSAATVVVSGRQFRGISISVVYPPAAAARVAVAKPSHSVLPGSLMCTCESTNPGKSTRSPNACCSASRGMSPGSRTDWIRPCSTMIAAGRTPSGVTTRLETKACVILRIFGHPSGECKRK